MHCFYEDDNDMSVKVFDDSSCRRYYHDDDSNNDKCQLKPLVQILIASNCWG
jgi:hypothetical protein